MSSVALSEELNQFGGGCSEVLHPELPNSSSTIVVDKVCILVLSHLLDFETVVVVRGFVLQLMTAVWRPTLIHCHSSLFVESVTNRRLGTWSRVYKHLPNINMHPM